MHSRLVRFLCTLILAGAATAPALLAAPKIAVVLKGRSAFWSAVEKGAQDAGTRLGADLVLKSPLNETDVAVQIQLLNATIAQGAEAVVIAPINKEALAVPIASAAVKGVKIVVIDTPLSGKAAPVFIGTDHEAAGRAAGRLLAEAVSDTDEIAILKHNQTSGATLARETGALAAFRELRPKNTLHADIYAGSEPGAEVSKCELLLDTHPHATAILSSGTPGTLAMLQVLKQRNLAGSIKLIGFGFNLSSEVAAAIEQGAMHGWIAQQPTLFGARGVEAAVALLKGETVAPVVHVDVVVVTKANLATPEVQALLKQ